MKLILRTVILLAAAALVAGLAVVIAGSMPARGGGFDGGRRPDFAQGQNPPGGIQRIRPGGDGFDGGGDGGDFGNATSNLFGLGEALVNLLVIGWITLMGVLGLRLLRWLREKKGGARAPSPSA